MTVEKFKVFSDIAISWITVIGVAAGGIFGLVQYSRQRHETRINRVFSFIERYHGPEVSGMVRRINEAWSAEDSPPPDETEQMFDAYILDFMSRRKLDTDLSLLVAFYDEIDVCIKADLCDEGAAREFFSSPASDLYFSFYSYLASIKKEYRDDHFAHGLEVLARPLRKPNDATGTTDHPIVNP